MATDIPDKSVFDADVELDTVGDAEVIADTVIGKTPNGKAYRAFLLNGLQYEVEDFVFVSVEGNDEGVDSIAQITEVFIAANESDGDGQPPQVSLKILWFYRPGETSSKCRRNLSVDDPRTIFLSFHSDIIEADSVKGKTTIHFLPPYKVLPDAKEVPGFIVTHLYDTSNQALYPITDRDYSEEKKAVLGGLLKRSRALADTLPDKVNTRIRKETPGESPPGFKVPRLHTLNDDSPRKLNRWPSSSWSPPSSPTGIRRAISARGSRHREQREGARKAQGASERDDSSESTGVEGTGSEEWTILQERGLLTSSRERNRCREMLLQAFRSMSTSDASQAAGPRSQQGQEEVPPLNSSGQVERGHQRTDDDIAAEIGRRVAEKGAARLDASASDLAQEIKEEDGASISLNLEEDLWPGQAAKIAASLEDAMQDLLGKDTQKYKNKARQLITNLKKSEKLARGLIFGKLVPQVVLNFTPYELKEGRAGAEPVTQDEPKAEPLQKVDIKCKNCGKETVVIQNMFASGLNTRYQLECLSCGEDWASSQNAVSGLTSAPTNVDSTPPEVGLNPLATEKFSAVEKQLPEGEELAREAQAAVDAVPHGTVSDVPDERGPMENRASIDD